MTSGMEPEVKRYLKKVLYSFMVGFAWLFVNAMLGIYFELAFNDMPVIVNILFYSWLVFSLYLLLRYYYKVWKNDEQ